MPTSIRLASEPGRICAWTQRLAFRLAGAWLRSGCGLSVHGVDRIAGLDQGIFAPNHASHLDYLAVLHSLPPGWAARTRVAAATDHFYATPRRAWAMRWFAYNNFAFDRHGSGLTEYHHMQHLLAAGRSVLAFPEGTRSRNGVLGAFKPLLALLAAESGVPLIPVAVTGTRQALPPGAWLPRCHAIGVHFGEPVWATGDRRHRHVRALNDAVRRRVQSLLEDAAC